MRLLFLACILAVCGCANKPAYKCTAGDEFYYADHYTAIVITEEVVLIGECEENK